MGPAGIAHAARKRSEILCEIWDPRTVEPGVAAARSVRSACAVAAKRCGGTFSCGAAGAGRARPLAPLASARPRMDRVCAGRIAAPQHVIYILCFPLGNSDCRSEASESAGYRRCECRITDYLGIMGKKAFPTSELAMRPGHAPKTDTTPLAMPSAMADSRAYASSRSSSGVAFSVPPSASIANACRSILMRVSKAVVSVWIVRALVGASMARSAAARSRRCLSSLNSSRSWA